MALAFRIELLWLFPFPKAKRMYRFPFFGHLYLPRPVTTSTRCSQIGYLTHLVPLRHVSYVIVERLSVIFSLSRFYPSVSIS